MKISPEGLVVIVLVACIAWFTAGYVYAKHQYQCDVVGGTSSNYNGHTTAIKLCRVKPK